MKVCIIGGGSSGITVAKTFFEQGIDFDCFEKGSRIGGNWLYNNDNGQSSSYKSLHINTSKQLMAYSDFPMPDHYPDYPHHSLIYDYFEDYIDHFGFRHKIQYNTTVELVEKLPNGKYTVTTNTHGTQVYDAVVVANGHHWDPKYPDFPGTFNGETTHSHYYKTFEGYEDKRVLIVGIGNSAVDIACELSGVASRTVISTRSGAYIVPKYLFGVPTDHISRPPLSFMPLAVQRAALMSAIYLNVGKQDNYGIPTPDRPILREHPTISQDLPAKVGHGKITIKPNIKELKGDKVLFEDGTEEVFDRIIYATGYKINFPFFKPDFLSVRNNEIQLYHKVVHPEHKNLFFVGLIQPLGAVMPLSEKQGIWIAALLRGKCSLPSKEKMLETIRLDRAAMKERYGGSSRHTIQVDFFPYRKLLEDEIVKNRVRNLATKAG
jgi:dimethylaniline monooxygenase (N-oxide forming)